MSAALAARRHQLEPGIDRMQIEFRVAHEQDGAGNTPNPAY
jgi:hypothetical protein